MNFIKKMFEGKIDDSVHRQFKRFSKGTFENRALVNLINSKSIKVKTSFEYANDFTRFLCCVLEEIYHFIKLRNNKN